MLLDVVVIIKLELRLMLHHMVNLADAHHLKVFNFLGTLVVSKRKLLLKLGYSLLKRYVLYITLVHN